MRLQRTRARTSTRTWAGLLALCAVPVAASCVAAAVGLTTVVAGQEFVENSTVAFMKTDAASVWNQTKVSLSRLSLDEVEIDDAIRAARCNIDGAIVTAHVETSGVNQTKLAVGARKWAFYDEEVATMVIERIKADMGR